MFDNHAQELSELKKNATKRFDDFNAFIKEEELKLVDIERLIKQQERKLNEIASFVSNNSKIDRQFFISFMKKPYKLKRISNEKYQVFVPKWVPDFQIGWLVDEGVDDEFYTYEINRFSSWLGDVPPEIADKLDLEPKLQSIVKDGKVSFSDSEKPLAEELFKGHILKWGVDEAEIKQGHEFDIILKIIESGGIPYEKKPVDADDCRALQCNFSLYDFQQEARALFKKTGAIGIFYPTGSGKSFIAMYCMDMLKGRKIVVTKKTLIDQWNYYFEHFAPRLAQETDIVTYELLRSRPEILRNEYIMAVYDECHRLPANSFAKLSLLNCKYRMGLSASPHREDGNEKMIFALTGYPIGLNWKVYMETIKRKYHPIYIHLVRDKRMKIRKVGKLLNMDKKTLIFSDSIDLGHAIGHEFGLPFVYGDSDNRMETMRQNKVVVVSRVADEGVSLSDIQRIIEVDFLYGSRQQEIQRTGRLMHSQKAEKHDIIMTDSEFESYGKRIWVLQEKGFHVKVYE